MTTRLTLLCHAGTRAMRDGGFPAPDDAIDPASLRKAEKAARLADCIVAPERAAQQTAAALSATCRVEPALRDADHGGWTGQGFAEVHAASPTAFAAWIADPAAGVPGGESFAAVAARVGAWLTLQAMSDSPTTAIAGPSVLRAAIAAALDLPAASVLRIDIAPLTRVTLSYNRGWRLQAIAPA